MLRNVVIISDFAFINGGQAKVAISSAIALADAGLNVTFFSAVGPVGSQLKDSNVNSVCLGQSDIRTNPNRFRAAISGIWNRQSARELKLLLEQFDPRDTVLHVHGFDKALSPSIGPVITSGKFVQIFTMHEYFLACPNGAFFDFNKNEICTRKALSVPCLSTDCDARHFTHKMWRVARQAVLRTAGRMPRRLTHVVFISQTQKRMVSPYLSSDVVLHYLPNPISVEKCPRVKAEKNEIFLFVGRLAPEKGGLMLARAAKHANIKVVFVGDGPEKEDILNVNPQAIVTGWVSSEEVQCWVRKSRCLVFPSLWYETFGLVVYEALANGIPAICGAWNAAAETIADGKTGLLYGNSIDKKFDAILTQMTIDRRVKQLSKCAYDEYWKAPLNMSTHVDNLMNLYGKTLHQHNRNP